MDLTRRKFQGVLNILSFNRHFYVFGGITMVLIIASYWLISWPAYLFWMVMAAFIYGLIMPLIVSAYVYDFSGYYRFDWLKQYPLQYGADKLLLNINAGFDETSFILHHHFPKATLRVFDFYNPEQHTEPAIIRARKVSLVYPGTQVIRTNSIPLNDKSADVIFLLSAAHEIRNHQEKVQFLQECYRLCKPGGQVIMVEHLRDFPNFLAFSVGFTHFFSRKTWKKAFTAAGFSRIDETKFTPFMSVFCCKP
jgi:SAM-dependent methyltransferase